MLLQPQLLKSNCALYIYFILFLIAPTHIFSQSSNDKKSQWISAGGEMLLSGKMKFNDTWTSSTDSRRRGLYWQGGFYDKEEERNYQPWEDAVKNAVSPKVGQITVIGPGNIGLYQKGMRARIKMTISGTEQGFTPWVNTISRDNENKEWYGTVKNFNPKGEFWGAIAPDQKVSLDVIAYMDSYNNMINTGEFTFHAPQEVEYEVWFFPRDGGRVINITPFGQSRDQGLGTNTKDFDSNDSGDIGPGKTKSGKRGSDTGIMAKRKVTDSKAANIKSQSIMKPMKVPGASYGKYVWDLTDRLKASPRSAISFEAKTNSDLVVGFSEGASDKAMMYEIVVGGFSNTMTLIRKPRQNPLRGHANVSIQQNPKSVVSQSQWASYWVSVNDGLVQFGKGKVVGKGKVLQWQDPDPIENINKVAFTGWKDPVEIRSVRLIPLE